MSYGEVITDQLNIAHIISTNEINEPSNTNGMDKNRGMSDLVKLRSLTSDHKLKLNI
jgi:hypothetical protein